MKKYFQFSICLLFTIGFFWQSANACTIVIPPLRKEFRHSANVFVGEVIDISVVPKDFKDKKDRLVGGTVKFRIEKSWKGGKKSEISLLSDIVDTACGGQLSYFRTGEKYLVFAEKDYVNFYKASKLENSNDKIKRLNDFGFRFWASIYPF